MIQLSVMGFILIPLGLICLFLKKEYLLYLTAFFSGFTGSSVIDFKSVTFSLQPAYFFGILFMSRHFLSIIRSKKIIKPNKLLTVFVGICIASLIMPVLLQNKNVEVLTPDNVYKTVKFTMQNVTQLAYIMYCFILYWFIKDYIGREKDLTKKMMHVFLWGALVISILSFYQEISYIFHLPYDVIFRSGVHGNIQPYGKFIRVYGVAQEPSMHALFITPFIGLALFIEKDLFRYKKLLLVVLILSGILSTSSSFILGLMILLGVILFDKLLKKEAFSQNKELVKTIVGGVVLLSIVMLILCTINPTIKKLMTQSIVDKLTGKNVSGMQRWSSFYHHIKVSLSYPLLGVGFGASRSKDLLSTWLANIGYVGVGVFITYLYSLCRKLKKVSIKEYQEMAEGNFYFIMISFALAFISVPEPYFLFLWISIAVSEHVIEDVQQNWYINFRGI